MALKLRHIAAPACRHDGGRAVFPAVISSPAPSPEIKRFFDSSGPPPSLLRLHCGGGRERTHLYAGLCLTWLGSRCFSPATRLQSSWAATRFPEKQTWKRCFSYSQCARRIQTASFRLFIHVFLPVTLSLYVCL